MTAIVGLQANGFVFVGGDSAGVGGLDISIRADPKVFRNGAFLFGMCGSFRMGQLLHHTFQPPTHPEGMDDYKYMVTLFIDAVRKAFKEGGLARLWASQELGGTFLVGYNGNLYRIDNDYQVGIPAEGFSAVGCGDQIAHGALYESNDANLAPERRVERALEAAAWFSAGVRAPFIIESLPPGLRSQANKSQKKKSAAKKKTPVKKKTAAKKRPRNTGH